MQRGSKSLQDIGLGRFELPTSRSRTEQSMYHKIRQDTNMPTTQRLTYHVVPPETASFREVFEDFSKVGKTDAPGLGGDGPEGRPPGTP